MQRAKGVLKRHPFQCVRKDLKRTPPTPVEVNIDIDKTQGNAIYSSLLGVQNTLDNFQLDVKKDSLREVVYEAIKDAVEEHLTEGDKAQLEKE